MSPRRLAALGLLLAATLLERFAFHSGRSSLLEQLQITGGSPTSTGTALVIWQALSLAGMLTAGIAAFGVSPWIVAAVAALVGALGHGALAGGASPTAGGGVVAFAAGALHVATLAAAAEAIARDDESDAPPAPDRFAAVAAFAVLAHAASSVGGTVATGALGLLHTLRGTTTIHGAGVVASIVATAAVVIAAVLGLHRARAGDERPTTGPYRAPGAASAKARAPVTAALTGLALLLVPAAASGLGNALSWVPPASRVSSYMVWMYAVTAVMSTVASIAVFLVLLVAVVRRSTTPPLLLLGAGLVVAAIGAMAFGASSIGGPWLWTAGSALLAVGGAAAWSIPVAYAALAVRGRAASIVIAGWLVISHVMGNVGGMLVAFPGLQSPIAGLAGLLGLGCGAVLLARGRRLHFRFFDVAVPGLDAPRAAGRSEEVGR